MITQNDRIQEATDDARKNGWYVIFTVDGQPATQAQEAHFRGLMGWGTVDHGAAYGLCSVVPDKLSATIAIGGTTEIVVRNNGVEYIASIST